MRFTRRILLVLVFALILGASLARAFDNVKTHPDLSEAAAQVFEQSSSQSLTGEQIAWITQGSIDEDADPRYLNHYYDPSTGKGLNESPYWGMPAKDWAKYQSSATGDYSVSAILENYRDGNSKRAYQGIGHIIHLIQDMAVPAHTRNDAHPEGDPFEGWARDYGQADTSGLTEISVNNLDKAFDVLASYSHNNFFSKDSVPADVSLKYKKIEQNVDGKKRMYLIDRIGGVDYKIAYSQNPDSIKPVFSVVGDPLVHSDYWKLLYSKAVGYSAGVIDYFEQEFTRIDQEKQEENLSLWQKMWRGFMVWNREINYTWGDAFMTSRLAAGQAWNSLFGNNNPENSPVHEENDQLNNNGSVLGDTIVNDEDNNNPKPLTPAPLPTAEEVSVQSVIDGDTIVLTDGRIIKYLGINAPELGAPGSQDDECLAWVARLRNLELLQSGKLKLIKDSKLDKDSQGNFLRYVYAGDTFLNAVMGREGLAKNQFCPALNVDCQTVSDTARQKIIKEALNDALVNKRGLYSGVCGTAPKLNSQTQPVPILNNETPEDSSDDQTDDSGSDESSNPNPTETDPVVVNESNNDYLKQFAGSIPSPVNNNPDFKISAFNLFDLVSGNIYYSASTSVGIDIESSGFADAYFFSTASTTPGLGDSGWLAKAPETFLLPAGDGLKQVYLWVKKDNKIISSATAVIYLDTLAPEIVFSTVPSTFASSATSTFVLATNEVGSALRYRFDSEAWQNYLASSTINNTSPLAEGTHILNVEAMDLSGNIGTSSYSWLVDYTAPSALILNLNSEYSASGFTVEWQGSDTGIAMSSEIKDYDLEYQIDTGAWQPWLSATASTSTIFSQAVVDGAVINFRVRARDMAGNLGAWSVIASTKISEPDSGVSHVVISEIRIENRNTDDDVFPDDEFVELYNPTKEVISLKDYRLTRKTKSGKEYNLLTNFPDVNLPAYSFFLITHPSGYTEETAPDAVYSSESYAITHDNTVILYDANHVVQDKVGFGEAIDYETAPFPEFSAGNSIERKAIASSTGKSMYRGDCLDGHCYGGNGYDSNNNSLDFIVKEFYDSEPENSASDPEDPAFFVNYPKHQWLFTEGSGLTIFDQIGSEDLSLSTSTWREDGFVQLVSEAEVEKDLNSPFNTDKDFSISFWVTHPYDGMPLNINFEDLAGNNLLGLSIKPGESYFLAQDKQFLFDRIQGWRYVAMVYHKEKKQVLFYLDEELLFTVDDIVFSNQISHVSIVSGPGAPIKHRDNSMYNLIMWDNALVKFRTWYNQWQDIEKYPDLRRNYPC